MILFINDKFCIDKNNQEFYDFILLKNHSHKSNLKYIGIILDMINDLHFYIIPNYRGQGYLQKSMNSSILPFLSCYKNRQKQRLSFDKLKLKEYFINQFNFQSISDLKVEKNLNSDDIKLYTGDDEKSIQLTDDIKNKMINNLNEAILKIRMINRQLNYIKYDTCEYEKNYLNDIYWKMRDEISYKN